MSAIAEVVEWRVATMTKGSASPGQDEIVLSVALRDGADAADVARKIAAKLLDETGIVPDVIDVLPQRANPT
jgi:hypothetical protein